MDRWRVLISDGLAREGLEVLRPLTELIDDPALDRLSEAEGWIVRSRTRVTAERLAAAPRLRVIGRAGVGVDNIDLDAARAAGIPVVNAPEAASQAVAEHVLGLMLALMREVPRADQSMRRGEWEKAGLVGEELAGKTLGLIGFGRIGRAVARRASAFGMQVLAHDPFLRPEEIRRQNAEPVDLPDLLRRSDVISLHLPLTDATRGLLDGTALQSCRPGARLISTARGGVVSESALLEALESGRLAGAALDVFEHEPPGASALVQHPKVITTPHIAAQTREAQARASVDIATEVLAALRGDPLRWRVA